MATSAVGVTVLVMVTVCVSVGVAVCVEVADGVAVQLSGLGVWVARPIDRLIFFITGILQAVTPKARTTSKDLYCQFLRCITFPSGRRWLIHR
jgi:hypothetical protein